MALPLESTIMEEIGLGNHYGWYNGSGSCEYIRGHAVAVLPEKIDAHNQAGDEIAPSVIGLIHLASQVADRGDENRYTLTKTWQTASYVIAAHIHKYNMSEEEWAKYLDRIDKHIRQNFLGSRGLFSFGR